MSGYTLVTSGFMIPFNPHFTKLETESTYRDLLLGDSNGLDLVPNLASLIEQGVLYNSSEATEAYLEYNNEPNFVNYMRMVDLFTSIFTEVNMLEFLKTQIHNPYLSPLGFSIVINIITGYDLDENVLLYSSVPTFFTMAKKASREEMATRETRFKEAISNNSGLSSTEIVTRLVHNERVFSSIFKFMLTDFNKGGGHV